MAVREYVRLCKQAGCGEEFTVSAPSIESDRVIGLSEPEYCPRHRALHAKSYSRIACHHYDVEMTAEGELLARRIEQQKVEESSLFSGTSGRVFYPWAMPDEGFGPGGLGCFERPLRGMVEGKGFEPQAKVFQIADKMGEILEALEEHQVVVLVGTTGSGKSTYVPWHLLTGGVPGGLSKWARRGPICVTQPRIQATRQVPRFIANALNGTALGVGSQIGFSHSRSDDYDRRTRLIFKTDGKLINDIVSGAVGNYSIVMIDEAHERSKNIDLILGLLKDQLYLYPHLRVIIASATIDQESFINFFGGPGSVPYVYSEGRRFPIAEHWWGDPKDLWWKQVNHAQLPERDQLPYAITELTRNLCESLDKLPPLEKEQRDGHILVFLPGADEIDKTVGLINSSGLPNVISLPLYARRPLDEQEAALNPTRKAHPQVYGKRRVVVSTNVAETSLTVEGVKFVIDSGFIKESYWNPVTEVSEMRTVRHSRAGCRQRWGRAGRVSPGDAYMLYTRELFEDSFPKDSTPEIARSSLEEIVLTAKAAGVRTARGQNSSRVLDFDWMPLSRQEDSERFRGELGRAYKSLIRQKALDEDGDLTAFGLELRKMPAALEVTRIFTEGERHAMGIEVATLLPFLKLEYGVQTILRWEQTWDTYHKLDVRRQQSDFAYGCHDDLELYLKLWMLWEGLSTKERQQWEEASGVNYRNFQEKIEEERKKLLESATDRRKSESRGVSLAKINALRALIAFCMRGEIYVPIEDAAKEEASPIDRRLRSSGSLEWESYWEDAGQYEESDEELVIDPIYSAEASERSGVYRRLESPRDESDESALIELAPTSVNCGRADANVFVACQRRANFRRPARSRVVGMNVVRLEPEWLTSIRGTLVQRAKLFAALSRLRAKAEHERLKVRLFLPWLVPRGTVVKGEVKEWSGDRGARFELAIPLDSEKQVVKLHRKMLRVEGWLPPEEIGQGDQPPAGGADTKLQVVDYSLTQVGAPMLVLGKRRGANRSAFQSFAKRHPKGSTVEVEMRQVLEDPLGRSPVFIVRETTQGIDIPMADTDFCGGARPQSYFGRRFGVGERFEVEVDEVAPDLEMVFLTRGRQLLREYAGISYQNFTCIDVTVVRVDRAGAYLAVNPSGYVGFARRALWPVGFDPKVGERVRARIRRLDRHVDVKRVEEQLKDGEPMPSELNLGVELDLIIPPAYERFRGTHRVGDVITVTAEKPLDNGGLLVALTSELKGIIFRTELDLDDEGRLKRARDYEPGSPHAARIFRMEDGKAMVNCSLFRKVPPPESLAPGQTVAVCVLDARGDSRDSNRLWLTCSFGERHQVQVSASAEALEEPPRVGDRVHALVSRVDRGSALIQATYVGPVDDSARGD